MNFCANDGDGIGRGLNKIISVISIIQIFSSQFKNPLANKIFIYLHLKSVKCFSSEIKNSFYRMNICFVTEKAINLQMWMLSMWLCIKVGIIVI